MSGLNFCVRLQLTRRMSTLSVASAAQPSRPRSYHACSPVAASVSPKITGSRVPTTQVRSYSGFSATPEPTSRGSVKIWHLFSGLLVFGVTATAWGLYEFYSMLTMWPVEVRGDLRAGIKAKQQNNLFLSQRYLRRAWSTAQSLPIGQFGSEPHLKTSGIAIALAEVLEEDGKPEEAYEVYSEALTRLRTTQAESPSASTPLFTAARGNNGGDKADPEIMGSSNKANAHIIEKMPHVVAEPAATPKSPPMVLTGKERLRLVALAHHLGEMAETYSQPAHEQEKWLSYAVEDVLRIVADEKLQRTSAAAGAGADPDDELPLPAWATRTDLSAPVEALGAFYAQQDRVAYAFPLYQTALSMLLKDSPPPTAGERCRGAQVMNNLAELIVKSPPPKSKEVPDHEYLDRAEQYALHAEETIHQAFGGEANAKLTQSDGSGACSLCTQVLPVVLFNLGMIHELQGRRELAKDNYGNSYILSRRIGLTDGMLEAQAALQRLKRDDENSKKGVPGVS